MGASNPSYAGAINVLQGANTLVVDSTGTFTVVAGATYTNAAAGTYSGANSITGSMVQPFTSHTTAGTITNFGHTVVNSTGSTGGLTFTLTAPAVGSLKTIFCSGCSTGKLAIIDATTAADFLSTDGAKQTITLGSADNEFVNLRGRTAAIWDVVGRSAGVTST